MWATTPPDGEPAGAPSHPTLLATLARPSASTAWCNLLCITTPAIKRHILVIFTVVGVGVRFMHCKRLLLAWVGWSGCLGDLGLQGVYDCCLLLHLLLQSGMRFCLRSQLLLSLVCFSLHNKTKSDSVHGLLAWVWMGFSLTCASVFTTSVLYAPLCCTHCHGKDCRAQL